MDPLEAKAAEGDPIAACQFAARNIRACALERQRWSQGALTNEPACSLNPTGANADAYLDNAESKLRAGTATYGTSAIGKEFTVMGFAVRRVSLATSELLVMVGAPDKAVELTEDIELKCTPIE